MTADYIASKKSEGGWINLTMQRVLSMSITSSSFYHTAIYKQNKGRVNTNEARDTTFYWQMIIMECI